MRHVAVSRQARGGREADRRGGWSSPTVGTCLRNRVTGLAAEAAFFALLSLPPLVFGLAGVDRLRRRAASPPPQVERGATGASSTSPRRPSPTDAVDTIIVPTIDDVLEGGRFDVISIGFILALWSGSRALNVFVDTITIMYGLGGHRGIVKTRVLSFVLYVLALVTGIVTLPLVVAGPTLVDGPARAGSTSSTQLLLADRRRALRSASWRRSTTCRCRSGPRGASTCPGATFTLADLDRSAPSCCAGSSP